MKTISYLTLSALVIISGALSVSCKKETEQQELAEQTAEPVVIKLWENKTPPVSNELPVDAEVKENEGWISNVTQPELTVYPAPEPNGTALLMCPGGGYGGVAISHEGKDLAPILNKEGITLAVLKYRMPNGHSEVPGDDVKESLRILHERAGEWGIDVNRIGIGGASAGGHLASTIATHPSDDYPAPAFQMLLYPVISMKEGITHQGSRNGLLGDNPDQETVDFYSNELMVSSQTPPAFIAVSTDDSVVPLQNSLDYYNALLNNGVPSSLHIYPVGNHGWGTNPEFQYHDEWIAEMIAWLKSFSPQQ